MFDSQMAAGSAADSDGITVEQRSPEAVFALLGDDIRVGILRAFD